MFHIWCADEKTRSMYRKDFKNTKEDSGIDVRFPNSFTVPAGVTARVHLGIEVWCELDDKSVEFFLIPRSSIGKTPLRGLMKQSYNSVQAMTAMFINNSKEEYKIEEGVAMFQLIEKNLRPVSYVLADSLEEFTKGAKKSPHTEETLDVKSVNFFVTPSTPMPAYGDMTVKDKIELESIIDESGRWAPNKKIVFPPRETTTVMLGIRAACHIGVLDESKTTDQYEGSAYFLEIDCMNLNLLMKNISGVIDKGYRGELQAKVYNMSEHPTEIERGTFLFTIRCPWEVAGVTKKVFCVHSSMYLFRDGVTERGAGGFGSTGLAGSV